jgi:hypothetical protein
MELRLEAHLSFVDDRGRLVFEYLDAYPDTKTKLTRHGYHRTDNTFLVTRPRGGAINEYIGLDCTVRVKLRPCSFRSTYAHNYGEVITSATLNMLDIGRLEQPAFEY